MTLPKIPLHTSFKKQIINNGSALFALCSSPSLHPHILKSSRCAKSSGFSQTPLTDPSSSSFTPSPLSSSFLLYRLLDFLLQAYLEETQLAQIAKQVQKFTGEKNVRIKRVIDESLVAGFTIRYEQTGSKLIDMSVKKQLEEIAAQLEIGDISHFRVQYDSF